jgi:hypothetical protein
MSDRPKYTIKGFFAVLALWGFMLLIAILTGDVKL